jgi:hypothetical protein
MGSGNKLCLQNPNALPRRFRVSWHHTLNGYWSGSIPCYTTSPRGLQLGIIALLKSVEPFVNHTMSQ